jgi:chromosome segregation protein
VTLFLDNADRTAPPPSTMPTSCRSRAASSARQGSVYRINGKEARARDVQLLFADAVDRRALAVDGWARARSAS